MPALPLFGSHLSIAGSMCNALTEGASLGLSCVQVFTKNQQQWKAKPLDPAMVTEWLAQVAALGWKTGGPDNRGGIVSHASYLINLASCKPDLLTQSLDLMTDEIQRCETLAIPYLVHHPGSFVGWTREQGIATIASAYKQLFTRTRGYKTILCLEGTAGAGSQLGGPFEDLADLRAAIIDATGEPARVGFCLDTCHLHAAGHDMATIDAARATLDRFDALCGLANVKVLHINDSKGKLGSHLDRHDHIGHGWVGGGATPHAKEGTYSAAKLKKSGFATVMRDPRLAHAPRILETPKGKDDKGRDWDTINLKRLRSLTDA
jgi:deoxyribonuclease-4